MTGVSAPRAAIADFAAEFVALRRDLHSHPELAFTEERTGGVVAGLLEGWGYAVTRGVGGTGIVGTLRRGNGPRRLGLRADMDALPIAEETGLPYASRRVGVMHACGHDGHTAILLAAARYLAEAGRFSGTLHLIFQPAEEIGQGARAMLADGLYTRFPKPQAAIAFHDSAQLPAGTIGYVAGYTMANVDSVDVTVRGIGGHGAYPHLTKDPIVLAARIVVALQTLVSREVDPLDSAVVTVGSIHGGTKHNIIPDEAKLQITVRSYKPETRRLLLDGIARIARGEAIAAGMPEDHMPIVTIADEGTPAAFNTSPLTPTIAAAFVQRFGAARVVGTKPQMGGEDFSRYHLADPQIQSMLFWVGGVRADKWAAAGGDITKLPSIHSAQWAPDPEPTIATAIQAMTTAALTVLAKG